MFNLHKLKFDTSFCRILVQKRKSTVDSIDENPKSFRSTVSVVRKAFDSDLCRFTALTYFSEIPWYLSIVLVA